MPINISLFCKKLLCIFLFLSISLNAFSQQEINTSNYYELDNYRIYPQEKIITKWGVFGSCSNGMCYENNGYTTVKHIDFDNTALIFINRQLYFKEDLSDVDLDTLVAIYPDTPMPYGGQRYYPPVFSDKKNLYLSRLHDALTNSKSPNRVPLPQMQRINPYLFKNDQNEYVVILRTFNKPEEAIQKVDELKLDPNTLKYVVGSFYTDKNGLYLLGNFYNDNTHQQEKNKKVEDSHGQLVIPKITKNTISYGEAIYEKDEHLLAKYPYRNSDVMKRIGNYDILKNGKVTSGYYKNPAPEEFTIYPFIVDAHAACIFEIGDELYFKSTLAMKNDATYGLIFKTNKDYISVSYHNSEKEIRHFKELKLYSAKTDNYEPFEKKYYRQVDEDLYIYNGALYSYSAATVINDPRIDYAKLQRISYSNYYTDGNYMFYSSKESRSDDASSYIRSFQPIDPRLIIKDVDFATLEIVNENLLIDKNRIYTIKNDPVLSIQTIPRNKLGIKIIVIGAIKYQ